MRGLVTRSFIPFVLLLGACVAPTPPKPPRSQLEIRQEQTREYDTHDTRLVMKALLNVLQDDGFIVKNAVVDLHLLRGRNFTIGVALQSVGFTIFFGNMVVVPLWLQTVMGYDSFHSGLAVAPVAVFSVLFSPVIGMNMHKIDLRYLVITGFALFAFGSWYSSLMSPESTMQQIMLGRFLFGLGIPFFFIPLGSLIMDGLHGEELTHAAGLSNFLRTLGGAIGTAVFVTLWSRRIIFHHARLTETAIPGSPAYDQMMAQLGNAGMTNPQKLTLLDGLISQQAATQATLDVLYLTSVLFLIMIVFVFFAKPVKGATASGGH